VLFLCIGRVFKYYLDELQHQKVKKLLNIELFKTFEEVKRLKRVY
jgi:hypothetical protein